MKTTILLLSFCTGTLLLGNPMAQAQSGSTNQTDDVRAYFEVLRSDFNASKIRTINQVMKLTAPEAEAFWPLYREYEKKLAAVGDEKLALIREFFTHYQDGTLNDQKAGVIAEKWLKNTRARLDLWDAYHRKISKALSPLRAAQFLQIENQMALFIDIGIASEMPVIEPAAASSESAPSEDVPGRVITRTLERSARVVAINYAKRTATLLGRDGKKFTVKAGPAVVNFDQIQVDDQVNLTLTEQLVVYLDKSGTTPSGGSAALAARAPKGALPAGVLAETTETIGEITAIDLNNRTVTLQFEDGNTRTFTVSSDINLEKRKVGERVVFRLTQMIAIKVERSS